MLTNEKETAIPKREKLQTGTAGRGTMMKNKNKAPHCGFCGKGSTRTGHKKCKTDFIYGR